MIFNVLTLFPERYSDYTKTGLPARGLQKNLFLIRTILMRDFADENRPGRIDDTPYGGGPGMVVQPGPIDRALASIDKKMPVILFTPRGELLNQKLVREFSLQEGFTLISGYYEGVDQRVADHMVDKQISLGKFVLGSGDLAALCFIEAVTRLIPGYMGSDESGNEESDETLLEYPQYTRPAEYNGWTVPEVLLSGNHERIRKWREEQRQLITKLRQDNGG